MLRSLKRTQDHSILSSFSDDIQPSFYYKFKDSSAVMELSFVVIQPQTHD
jgi:hypothetical protein